MAVDVDEVEVICDAEFLEQRDFEAAKARVAAEAKALDALRAEDRGRSKRAVRRRMADALCGWRLCRLKICRRARRCRTDATLCVGARHNAWPLADEVAAIDDTYAALQLERLELAEAEDAGLQQR
ncbi:hypothetical protein RPB_1338 [Rhodopseudomonas palustris HaA2]|uniref:Uncharacterized protein n=1 Tax=Rhodopseudomonas palustris (strain HaA2) TaxID=316058 RepID=Q2J0G2_RHOP2|nr:hypothetical protein [Rhodopseudomonas palustris]ABD06048.1 hypothetical protein RPB_1338 [Rhodopseudomonas palustris HaA2]